MAGVYELNHKGKNILCLDIADMKTQDKPEFHKHIELAKEKIRKMPEKSTLIITNVTNIRFDTEMANSIKKYAEHNTPYVKASAIVGLSGLQKIIYMAVKTITGRDFYLANTLEDAMEWLVKQ
jgi:trimethylamine:corrinoid methyltransferase-like protein